MTFDDIKASEIREKIFPMVLEEACRQWCEFLPDAPERADGEGFAEFFYEIFRKRNWNMQDRYMKWRNMRQ